MEKTLLKRCPICGTKLNGENENDELLNELDDLKEKGVLQQTMFIAVRIIHSMSESNLVWLKEVLDEQSSHIKESIQKKMEDEIRPILQSISEIKGNPLTIGRIQEEAIAKRLSSLKTGEDRFDTEQSRRSQEDVECTIVENGREIGKIVIESKRTKDWQDGYTEQIKQYMERKGTEFGILATTALPDDALNNTTWRSGVLVVKPNYIEQAYIFMREHLKLKSALEKEYSARIRQLQVRDQILEELKNAVTSGQLDTIIEHIDTTALSIDSTVSKAENYLSRLFKDIKKDTNSIRELTSRLVSEHIEKIRNQLVQETLIVMRAEPSKH